MDHPFSMSLNPMTALKDVKYATSVSTLYNLTLVLWWLSNLRTSQFCHSVRSKVPYLHRLSFSNVFRRAISKKWTFCFWYSK